MSDEDFVVNYGALETLSAAMKQGSAQSQADLEAMKAELRPAQSGWSGEAHQQYTICVTECESAITDQHQLIQQLGTHVDTSHGDYKSTDHQAARPPPRGAPPPHLVGPRGPYGPGGAIVLYGGARGRQIASDGSDDRIEAGITGG